MELVTYLKFNLFLVLFGARFKEKHDRTFDQGQKYKTEWHQQIPVKSLWVADFRQVTIERSEKKHDGQDGGDPQGHTVSHVIFVHPEHNPAQDYNKYIWKVDLNKVIADASFKWERGCHSWKIP